VPATGRHDRVAGEGGGRRRRRGRDRWRRARSSPQETGEVAGSGATHERLQPLPPATLRGEVTSRQSSSRYVRPRGPPGPHPGARLRDGSCAGRGWGRQGGVRTRTAGPSTRVRSEDATGVRWLSRERVGVLRLLEEGPREGAHVTGRSRPPRRAGPRAGELAHRDGEAAVRLGGHGAHRPRARQAGHVIGGGDPVGNAGAALPRSRWRAAASLSAGGGRPRAGGPPRPHSTVQPDRPQVRSPQTRPAPQREHVQEPGRPTCRARPETTEESRCPR
jgi:hypothetical protein